VIGRAALARFLRARVDRESYLGLRLTLGAVACALAIWAFGGVLDGVLDGEWVVRLDRVVEDHFHATASAAGLRAFSVITELGLTVVIALAIVVTIVLWRRRERLLLWTWLAAIGGGKVIEWVLKHSIRRARPQYAAAYLRGHSYSFPSGHSMGSTICYVMLAFIVIALAKPARLARVAIWIVSVAIVLLVGFSRLYLGVHYPSDVVGGFAAGAAWLAVCLTTLDVARRRPASPAPLLSSS
jgi:membrane-associated phospholipid phosphatase